MLSIQELSVSVITGNTPLDITRNVSFDINKGEILGVVGESGCGKSMTALAIMGLLPNTTIAVRSGRVLLDDKEITYLEPHQRVDAGLSGISMIFQEPMTSLNPVMQVGDQIIEALLIHDQGNVRAPSARAKELLDLVRIPDAAMQLKAYPHELSGGMRQRIMIAIALACNPLFLVADEPTTALDVTIQAQILSLLKELCEELSMGVLFITHDLGVVAQLADRVCVMYAGQIVEIASVEVLYENPVHPYTHGLFSCLPDPTKRSEPLIPIPGQAPLLTEITDGCAFAARCEYKTSACLFGSIDWTGFSDGHKARCHNPLKVQN